MSNLEDVDRFNEYWQDKEDESRLPRKVRDETEKDLIFFTWSGTDSGKFLDDKQTLSRIWQAPQEPGDYVININAGDLALVRPPDTGSRKDTAKTLTIHVAVENLARRLDVFMNRIDHEYIAGLVAQASLPAWGGRHRGLPHPACFLRAGVLLWPGDFFTNS